MKALEFAIDIAWELSNEYTSSPEIGYRLCNQIYDQLHIPMHDDLIRGFRLEICGQIEELE